MINCGNHGLADHTLTGKVGAKQRLQPTRNFERNFARWGTELRSISSAEELETFINRRFLNDWFDSEKDPPTQESTNL